MPSRTVDHGWTVPHASDGVRLVDHAHAHLVTVRRRSVGPLIAAGHVTVDGAVGKIAQRLAAGASVVADAAAVGRLVERHHAAVPSGQPLDIVHEDDVLIAIDKPHGLHHAPTGGHGEDAVTTRLLWVAGARPDQPWGRWRPHPVHRLDRAASGLLLFAKDAATADVLQAALRAGTMHRTYRATVEGVIATHSGTIDDPLGPDPNDSYRRAVLELTDERGRPTGAQTARTHWSVAEHHADSTTLHVRIETGRTHQVRAHLASIGHPILGDTLYGAASRQAAGIALRSSSLTLPHPTDGRALELSVAALIS